VPDAVIRLEDVSRVFPTRRALAGLSFEVPPGLVFGFLGPNGAGKTTTIRLLLGLLEPTAGSVEVLGFPPVTRGNEVRSRAGAVLEQPGLYDHLSAEENLEFYGRAWRLPTSERRARIRELLTRIDQWEKRTERVGKWSTGMRQRLALARALLHRPPLLLLDEPTSGLDVMAATSVRNDLLALVEREGTTIFLTTHNMAEAEVLCGRVAVVREGRLLAVGHPDELRAEAGGTHVEIVGTGFFPWVLDRLTAQLAAVSAELAGNRLVVRLRRAGDVPRLVRFLVEAGVEVEEVRRGKTSLEEVFRGLVEGTP
jgi:ABC-2 type transport system ATP-binding protein